MRRLNQFTITIILLTALQVPAAFGQRPELTVDGKSNNGVTLQKLNIDVTIYGNISRTTWRMTFYNNTSRILEGTLVFPLKDGVSISRYALDINGNMREAVPVDRGKGTAVFEAVERRRVDPGLLEKVDGNAFRTRIYPINPHATRTVIIAYEEEIPIADNGDLKFTLPLNLKDTVQQFALTAAVIQSAASPEADQSNAENIHFDHRQNIWSADISRTNYVPNHPISFAIPRPADASEVMLQEQGNKYYYFINTTLQPKTIEKPMPHNIGLLWDASLSGAAQDTAKELALLGAYLKKVGNAQLTLVQFSNSVTGTKNYTISNGDWSELREALRKIIYDGATNFGCLDLSRYNADEFLLVSDGHQTFGEKHIKLDKRPVFCINASAMADYSNLKLIALKSGGQLVDLVSDDNAKALDKLIMQPLHYLGIKGGNEPDENYPSLPVTVGRTFSLAGITRNPNQSFTLQFGFGDKVSIEKTITIDPDKNAVENVNVARLWAQKKISELDMEYDANRQDIESLGKRYGLVTRNTSLIVLESVYDYINYGIEPPQELRADYDAIMKQRETNEPPRKRENLTTSEDMLNILKAWWHGNEKSAAADTSMVETRRPATTATPSTNNVAAARPSQNNAGSASQSPAQAPVILRETVITGDQTQLKNDVVGSVATVDVSDANKINATASEQLLQGREPGVTVVNNGAPGAPTDVYIRGTGNVGNVQPTYVVDGVLTSDISKVNPNDIKSISVLKDKSAAAVYGVSGSNGVVIVNTKNGSGQGANSTNAGDTTRQVQLGEVVVTGALGIKTQARQLGYATATVDNKSLTEAAVTNVATGLEGKVSGLQINTTDNGVNPSVRIILRGNRSITGNNQPLLVVDGMPIDDPSYINDINPNDIQDITVLKGGVAAAIYGSKASNGVLVITTKKGIRINSSEDTTATDSTSADSASARPPVHHSNTPSTGQATIDVSYHPAEADYLKTIARADAALRYQTYIKLRPANAANPIYYFNVGSYFIKMGDKELGGRILSNLAELDLGSYELYKMLGYRLKQEGDYEGEVFAFKKVTELRPLDPQSFRDYGLALEDAGEHQKALDVLYEAMTKSYTPDADGLYRGIQEVFLPEINHIIAANKSKLNLSKISKSIIADMPVDIRIVMNWNMNNTDIDLWVTDPNGEKCYYSHNSTEIGGRISHDMTQGFGPEQFLLKKAIKGTYKIEINYFGARQVSIAGPTTVMAELYTHFGTPQEKREIIVFQLKKDGEKTVYVGDLDFK